LTVYIHFPKFISARLLKSMVQSTGERLLNWGRATSLPLPLDLQRKIFTSLMVYLFPLKEERHRGEEEQGRAVELEE